FEEEILDASVQANETIPLFDEEIVIDAASSDGSISKPGSGGEEAEANYCYNVYHDYYKLSIMMMSVHGPGAGANRNRNRKNREPSQVLRSGSGTVLVPVRELPGKAKATAFESLKRQLTTTTILTLPIFKQTFIVEMDDADAGIVGFRRQEGMVIFPDRYYVRAECKLKPWLLREFHDKPILGHEGVKKMMVGHSAVLYWKGMRKAIEAYLKQCCMCQQTKYSIQEIEGYLQPLAIPTAVWEDLCMDFITGKPVSKGLTVVLVVVDRFSKDPCINTKQVRILINLSSTFKCTIYEQSNYNVVRLVRLLNISSIIKGIP
nr:Ty3/gypsy retrotransposon protein [Tanacetum cinerariifolium]